MVHWRRSLKNTQTLFPNFSELVAVCSRRTDCLLVKAWQPPGIAFSSIFVFLYFFNIYVKTECKDGMTTLFPNFCRCWRPIMGDNGLFTPVMALLSYRPQHLQKVHKT